MFDVVVGRAAALVTRTEPPKIFTELGRHPALFRAWLPFAAQLLLRGTLPRADTELVILRTAWNCGSSYEWEQHVGLAARAGLTTDRIELVARQPISRSWSRRQQLLLHAADELHSDRAISVRTRDQLRAELSDRQLVELCLLVGHYEMLAMLLNTNEVTPDRRGWDLRHWFDCPRRGHAEDRTSHTAA